MAGPSAVLVVGTDWLVAREVEWVDVELVDDWLELSLAQLAVLYISYIYLLFNENKLSID